MPRKKKDPTAPKRPLSSYMFFSKKRRAELQEEHADWAFGEYSRRIAEEWKTMGEEAKQPFAEESAKDKTRYETEMNDYRAQKKLEGDHEEALPQEPMRADYPLYGNKDFTTQQHIEHHLQRTQQQRQQQQQQMQAAPAYANNRQPQRPPPQQMNYAQNYAPSSGDYYGNYAAAASQQNGFNMANFGLAGMGMGGEGGMGNMGYYGNPYANPAANYNDHGFATQYNSHPPQNQQSNPHQQLRQGGSHAAGMSNLIQQQQQQQQRQNRIMQLNNPYAQQQQQHGAGNLNSSTNAANVPGSNFAQAQQQQQRANQPPQSAFNQLGFDSGYDHLRQQQQQQQQSRGMMNMNPNAMINPASANQNNDDIADNLQDLVGNNGNGDDDDVDAHDNVNSPPIGSYGGMNSLEMMRPVTSGTRDAVGANEADEDDGNDAEGGDEDDEEDYPVQIQNSNNQG